MPPTVRELLDESIEIEQLGGQIQGKTRRDQIADLGAAFTERYDRWFARSVAMLPEDLRARFRGEREGAWHTPKIRSFLESPLEPNVLFKAEEVNLPGLSPWLYPFDRCFRAPLLAQRQILLESDARAETERQPTASALLLEVICRRFGSFVASLQDRPRSRTAITVKDEYDVQYLLGAVLCLFFSDVRPEERTPSRAGGGAIMDFFLMDERIAVETKMMRASLTVKALANELILDIARYAARPDVDELVVLVVDPMKKVSNSAGFVKDLTGRREGLNVLVIVSQ
jgi:hypothetical protein